MSRWLERDPELGGIRIRFPYDPAIVAAVKALPGRRWHADKRCWSVPEERLLAAAELLVPLGFRFSDELKDALAGVGAPRVAEPAAAYPRETERALSVSQLNEQVRAALQGAFPQPLWIQGEVIGFDRNAHKKHVYFQLAEKGSAEEPPRAVVTAVLFAGVRARLERMLAAQPEPIAIQDGLALRVCGRVDLYPASGSYQIVIEDLDPSYSLGEMARRREQVLAELERRGLRERNLALPFPLPSLRVGLITSFASDAYHDFINELERSRLAFEIDVFDVHVQGQAMEKELLRALGWFGARAADYDVVAIVRGGGARTDLMHFDSLPIAVAVAELPIKVVVGIGHHRDRGVLDSITHSEKTPTACAQKLVALAMAEIEALAERGRRLRGAGERALALARGWLERGSLLVRRTLELRIERSMVRLRRLAAQLGVQTWRRLERAGARLAMQQRELVTGVRAAIALHSAKEQRGRERLVVAAPARCRRAAEQLVGWEALARAADPARLLARGYAWIRDARGRSVKSVRQPQVGDALEARLTDGTLLVEVKRRTGAGEE